MKFILGRKLEMTEVFTDDGLIIPVTKVLCERCFVTQLKTPDQDGYQAIQLGFGQKKKIKKPLAGHLKGLNNFRFLREFRTNEATVFPKGQAIKVESLVPGELVDVQAFSKGKGFAGVVKRHHFHGAPASHGTKDQLRMPGSAGPTFPQHVIKGRRMPGRMGHEKVTVKNLEVIKIDPAKNELYLKGAVPGARNNLVLIRGIGNKAKKFTVEEIPVEEKEKKPASSGAAKKK